MSLRDVMISPSVFAGCALETTIELGLIDSQSLPSGEIEVDDSLSKGTVKGDIQSLSPLASFQSFGIEKGGTDIGTFPAGTPLREGMVIKAVDGPHTGNHYRVTEIVRNEHHIEAVLRYLVDETRLDTIGAL